MITLNDLTEANIINERLESLYGRHVELSKPNFRVVWAPNQIEKRYTNRTESGVYIEGKGIIREMPKYPWCGNQWIVERVHPNYHKDVADGDFIYESLWAFPEGLPLKWEAIDLCCKIALKIVKNDLPKSEKEALALDEAKREDEKQHIRDLIDTTSLETALNDKNALSYSNSEGIDYRPSHLDKAGYGPES